MPETSSKCVTQIRIRGLAPGHRRRKLPAGTPIELASGSEDSPFAVGVVEHVLHAGDLSVIRGVPELFEADVARADAADETFGAGLDQWRPADIEARLGAAGAGLAEV